MILIPTGVELRYWLEMADTSVINYRHLNRWADAAVMGMDKPHPWICDLAIKKYQPDVLAVLRGAVYENCDLTEYSQRLDKFHVGCLYFRYKRREWSFATMLNEMGRYLDSVNGDWVCEYPYGLLNDYEVAEFSQEIENELNKEMIKRWDIGAWVGLVENKYEIFRP